MIYAAWLPKQQLAPMRGPRRAHDSRSKWRETLRRMALRLDRRHRLA